MSKKFTFKSKLVDSNYVNYNQMLPQGDGTKIAFNRTDMINTLSRVSVLTNDKFKGVKLKSENGILDITAFNPDQESAEERLDATGSNTPFEIAFNVFFLKEVLSTIEDDEVSLVVFGSEKPALIQTNDSNLVHCLSPILI
jgi:DNA polymerase-3 subunit beta